MKKGIHPNYGPSVVKCACGNEIKTHSTVSELSIEICSACHPFYTGQKKIVDSAGRVDRFKKRLEIGQNLREEKQKKTATKKPRKKNSAEKSETLKIASKKIKSKK